MRPVELLFENVLRNTQLRSLFASRICLKNYALMSLDQIRPSQGLKIRNHLLDSESMDKIEEGSV